MLSRRNTILLKDICHLMQLIYIFLAFTTVGLHIMLFWAVTLFRTTFWKNMLPQFLVSKWVKTLTLYWGQHIPPKRWYPPTSLHGITAPKDHDVNYQVLLGYRTQTIRKDLPYEIITVLCSHIICPTHVFLRVALVMWIKLLQLPQASKSMVLIWQLCSFTFITMSSTL